MKNLNIQSRRMPGASRRCNNEPPEGLAMAGLVGILRQLGDLAELAADVFQELQDQVMDVSARGRRLAARAKQLEDDLHPLVYDAAHPDTERVRWHMDPKVSHGVVAGANMPFFIAEHIKQCRGPPGLSILDKYDAVGNGACLRRYTDPSFFRANSAKLSHHNTVTTQAYHRGKKTRPKFQSYKVPKPAPTDARSETENASPRFLSMLRLLKHGQTSGSLKPQLNIEKFGSSSEEKEKDSSVDHSQFGISSTSSPDLYIAVDTTEKAKENQDYSVMPYCSDELGRTSSFEAWLSQDFPTPDHDVTQESYHDTCNGILSHGIGEVAHCGTMKAKQDSVSEEISTCSKDADVVVPPLPPIPPMQWLSDRVHIVHRKPHGKYHSEGKILKTSDEPPQRPTENQSFECKGTDNSAVHGSRVSTSEATKAGNAAQPQVHQSVFISAVRELAKTMSPPSVPRPKQSLLGVESHDGIKLRNGPGVIYPSRNLLDKTSEELILEQIKHKVHGNSWNECDGKSDELELQSAADSAKVFGFGGDNVLGS